MDDSVQGEGDCRRFGGFFDASVVSRDSSQTPEGQEVLCFAHLAQSLKVVEIVLRRWSRGLMTGQGIEVFSFMLWACWLASNCEFKCRVTRRPLDLSSPSLHFNFLL